MTTTHSITPTSRTRGTPARLSVAALVAVATLATVGTPGTAAAQAPVRDVAPVAGPAAASTGNHGHEQAVPRVVRQWERAWNTGDGDRMASLFTKNAVYQDFSLNYRFTGRSEISGFVEESVRNVTGLHVDVTDAFRSGDRIGVRFVFTGQVNGAPRPFSVPVFTVMELRGNKITYDGDYYNRLELLTQSGLPTS